MKIGLVKLLESGVFPKPTMHSKLLNGVKNIYSMDFMKFAFDFKIASALHFAASLSKILIACCLLMIEL